MPKFEPDFKVILKHLRDGDFGIAEKIHKETQDKIVSNIDKDTIKQQFLELNKINRDNGIFSQERAIIKSLMETNKMNVLFSLHLLKMFGQLEIVRYKYVSGPNPELDPTSFISTARRIEKDLPEEYTFKGVSTGRMPNKILLNKYLEGNFAEPTLEEIDGNVWVGQWPQVGSLDEYTNSEIGKIQNSNLEDQFKNELITERRSNIEEEYNTLNEDTVLKNKNVPNKNAYLVNTVTNQDDVILNVNIENDYNIDVQKDGDKVLIFATLKPDLSIDTNILYNENGTARFGEPVIVGSPQTGLAAYAATLLPVILKDGLEFLNDIIQYISDTNEIVGQIITKHVSNEFEFLDPDLEGEKREFYYSGDELIFNGQTSINNKLININFEVNNGIITYTENSNDINSIEFLRIVAEFLSLTMNSYTDILNMYKTFLLKLMNPSSVVTSYAEYSTMIWLERIYNKENILKNLKSTDNSLNTTTLFAKGFDTSKVGNMSDFYTELINKFIEQIEAIYNHTLTKI